MATIEWVNHASFVLEQGTTRLITDPWLDGPAFDSGWDLLSKTRFSYEDFHRISHIWLSHEHPDHFSPPNLRSIPPEARSRITVLYQATMDHRVVQFCGKAGFRTVVEMRPGTWYALGDGLELLCEPHDNGDSWLGARTADGVLLNLNDCVVTSPRECRRIADRVGPVTVLASQFSYANRVANPGDQAAMAAAAAEKLDWLRIQVLAFGPRYVIPFASFVFFSHEDNFYLNSGMTTVGAAADLLRKKTAAVPVVLYPGDRWDLSDHETAPLQTTAAIERYERDMAAILVLHRSSPVAMETLLANGNAFVKGLVAVNGWPSRLLPPVHVYLEDLETCVRIAPRGVSRADVPAARCDLVCKSDSLDYAFRFGWGGRTLDINGRFRVPPKGRYWKFRTFATLAGFNSRSEGFREILGTVTGRVRKRLPL